MKNLIVRLKNRLIKLLGGSTGEDVKKYLLKELEVERYRRELIQVEKNVDYWYERCRSLERNLTKPFSLIKISDYPTWDEENIVEHTKELVYRKLGKAVYDYARHEIKDGKYTASVVVLRGYDSQ